MPPRQNVLLKFREPEAALPRTRLQSKGFSAEYVQIGSSSAFDYKWSGPSHYLALHDIRLRDGETFVDGELASRLCDLSQRMTFVPAGSAISGWSRPGKQANSFAALYYNPKEMAEELLEHYRSTNLFASVYFQDPALLSTLQKLTALLRRPASDRLYGESLGMLAIIELLRLQQTAPKPASNQRGGLSSRQQTILRDYIEDHLPTDMTLTELAAVAGLTRFHFARAFAVSFGEPPHRYVSRRRIDYARQLLQDTRLDVSDVAEKVGLKHPTLLARHMRKFVGVTPREFRRRSE
jgi:AraC family transcriptional regulator